jgi:hypothetical protein
MSLGLLRLGEAVLNRQGNSEIVRLPYDSKFLNVGRTDLHSNLLAFLKLQDYKLYQPHVDRLQMCVCSPSKQGPQRKPSLNWLYCGRCPF